MPLYSLTTTATSDGHAALARHFEQHHDHLVAYLADRLRPDVWARSEDLAQEVWLVALEATDVTDAETDDGLPAYLARIARAVARRESSPANRDEIEISVGFRGDENVLAAAPTPPPVPELRVTAEQYAIAHGDPATWTPEEMELQQDLAAYDSATRPEPFVLLVGTAAEDDVLPQAA